MTVYFSWKRSFTSSVSGCSRLSTYADHDRRLTAEAV